LAPILAIFVYLLVVVIVICVYLKEHLKLTFLNRDQHVIELHDEDNEIRAVDYEKGEIIPAPTGSPYYDRNTPNLMVQE
jgi:hypothetical protein